MWIQINKRVDIYSLNKSALDTAKNNGESEGIKYA